MPLSQTLSNTSRSTNPRLRLQTKMSSPQCLRKPHAKIKNSLTNIRKTDNVYSRLPDKGSIDVVSDAKTYTNRQEHKNQQSAKDYTQQPVHSLTAFRDFKDLHKPQVVDVRGVSKNGNCHSNQSNSTKFKQRPSPKEETSGLPRCYDNKPKVCEKTPSSCEPTTAVAKEEVRSLPNLNDNNKRTSTSIFHPATALVGNKRNMITTGISHTQQGINPEIWSAIHTDTDEKSSTAPVLRQSIEQPRKGKLRHVSSIEQQRHRPILSSKGESSNCDNGSKCDIDIDGSLSRRRSAVPCAQRRSSKLTQIFSESDEQKERIAKIIRKSTRLMREAQDLVTRANPKIPFRWRY